MFVVTKVCLSRQNAVVTKVLLQEKYFVATNMFSQQNFCHIKHTFVTPKDVFVPTKMILAAAPANDTKEVSEELLQPAQH